MRTVISQDIKAIFARFRQEMSIRTYDEAKTIMETFLQELRMDKVVYSPALRTLMEQQCKEALEAAMQVTFPTELGEDETCEWHIDIVGVALERRRYVLTGLTVSDIEESSWAHFPGDYKPQFLGISKSRATIPVSGLKHLFGLDSHGIYKMLSTWPSHYYDGDIRAISRIHADEGAVLYQLQYQTQHPPFWPTPRADRKGTSLI